MLFRSIETPLHLVFIGAPSDTDRAWHLRHAVDVGEGASLVLAEHHLADGPHRHLDTAALSLHLAPSARLRHARIHDAADSSEEPRVGTECVSTCSYRWSRNTFKK